MTPYPLLWFRYSTFIFLYPLGVASEMTMVYLSLPHIRRSHMWSIDLPNALNFGFDYFLFCLLAVIIYIPGTPNLKLMLQLTGLPCCCIQCTSKPVNCVQVSQCCICTCSIKERRCLASQSQRESNEATGQCFKEHNTALSWKFSCCSFVFQQKHDNSIKWVTSAAACAMSYATSVNCGC